MAIPIPIEIEETLDPEIYRLKVKCNTYAQRLVLEGHDDVEWERTPLIPVSSTDVKKQIKEDLVNTLSLCIDKLDEATEILGDEGLKKISDLLLTISKDIDRL